MAEEQDVRGGGNCTHAGLVTVHMRRVGGRFEREKAVCGACHEEWPTGIDFNADQDQTYFHSTGLGGHGIRVARYHGECICCETRTYGHVDGDDDPRGILGDHAIGWSLDPSDYGFKDMGFKSFVLCFSCNDTFEIQQRGIRMAKARWEAMKKTLKK